MKTTESEGQRRMLELHGGSRDNLEVSPNLWAGVGLARGGAGTALVGSHAEVADRIEEYAALGHRRVHPLGLPAPRGALLVRRGRPAPCSSSAGSWKRPVGLAEGMRTGSIDAGGVSFGVVPERR